MRYDTRFVLIPQEFLFKWIVIVFVIKYHHEFHCIRFRFELNFYGDSDLVEISEPNLYVLQNIIEIQIDLTLQSDLGLPQDVLKQHQYNHLHVIVGFKSHYPYSHNYIVGITDLLA